MAPIEPYICICLEKRYDNRKSLSLHENKCPVIKARDQIRYSPYHRQHRAERSIQTPYDEPAVDPTVIGDTNGEFTAAPVVIVDTADEVPDTQETASVVCNWLWKGSESLQSLQRSSPYGQSPSRALQI
ncbi:hypothetical protein FRC09_018837 [Ceratobasidium sp. 395]|nr:hypothetical protein FRC09_018837 [Ceratobasidium sp. 395]